MEYERLEPLVFDCSNKIQPFKCERCPNFRTNLLESFRLHVIRGHQGQNFEEKSYKCLQCSSVTFSRFLHLRHRLFSACASMDEEEKRKPLVCYRVDGTTFALKEEPITSTEENRKDADVVGSSHVESGGWNNSGQCESKFEDIHWFKCEQCPHKCKRKGNLKRHVECCHSKREDIKWLNCDHCPSKFKQKSHLKAHINNYHTEPKWKCDQCSLKFKEKDSLQNHIKKRHSKPKEVHWFECGQCTLKFKEKGSLRRHIINRHSKPEDIHWFKCDQCSLEFKQNATLKAHVYYRHSKPEDIRWFKCDECPYRSKRRGHWKRHVTRRHSKPEDGR